MSYTHKNLREVDDVAGGAGMGELLEARFANDALDTDSTGLAYHRVHPGQRSPAHRHENAEEVYVVLSGGGRMKLDDEIIEVREMDAIRVAPEVVRAFESDREGLEVLVFGPRHQGDGEILQEDVWGDA